VLEMPQITGSQKPGTVRFDFGLGASFLPTALGRLTESTIGSSHFLIPVGALGESKVTPGAKNPL
jgi:hypothetical protein